MIEDCAFHLMASVHCVEHSRAFENILKIALGRIPSHKISTFRCTCGLIENCKGVAFGRGVGIRMLARDSLQGLLNTHTSEVVHQSLTSQDNLLLLL